MDLGYEIAQSFDGKKLALSKMMANRHGLISGATGTGKTVTLHKLAECFSDDGVPVFMVDVKGDLSGFGKKGDFKGKIAERLVQLNLSTNENAGDDYFSEFPLAFWDIFAANGIPVRTTISELGPVLLSRLLNLNEVQEGVLNLAFNVADDEGLLLIDIKDLRSILAFVGEHADKYQLKYGNISKASIGAILRAILRFENSGSSMLFGEPALDLNDWFKQQNGKGVINILDANKLINSPQTYGAFLLWLMSELFENLPEVGDAIRPKFVMFFDEAHLIFDGAPKVLIDKIEQVVRLIRSKGVGIYFITQSPLDIPDSILGQLGNRILHAMRAFSPKDQKNIKAVAQTCCENKNIDAETAIKELAVGCALVSFLNEKGAPTPVETAYIYPPKSSLKPISTDERQAIIDNNTLYDRYANYVDNESAYEILSARKNLEVEQKHEEEEDDEGIFGKLGKLFFGSKKRGEKLTATETVVSNVSRAVGRNIRNKIAREITRGLLGAITKR